MSKAQARATREAVENEAFLADKLDEFRKLKGKSGNLGVAQDIIESSIKPDTQILSSGNLIGKGLDVLKSKLAGSGAVGIDLAAKGADVAIKKAPKVLGALAGGAVGLAAQAAEEGFDSEDVGGPLEQAALLRESDQSKRQSNVEKKFPQLAEEYKKMQQGIRVSPSETLKTDKLQNLQDLQSKFQSMKGSKGAEAVSPILESAISGTPEEKAKAEFQINQNPWLRNKLNKN